MQQIRPLIFIVDDERVISETLAAILNISGFDAISFYDPDRALAAAADLAPDLLISDVMMPSMSGVELAILFHTTHPLCKVLLFSGQAETANLLDDARKRGYDFELLAKPVHPRDLINKVRGQVSRPQPAI